MDQREEIEWHQLTEAEVQQLERQGCTATDWSEVQLSGSVDMTRLTSVTFVGRVRLGSIGGTVDVEALHCGMPSQISRTTLHDVTIGNSPFIQDVGFLGHYTVGDHFVAMRCGRITGQTDGGGHFGIGEQVSVVNEGGGREVLLSAHLNSNIAWCLAMHRYVPGLVRGYERLVAKEMEGLEAEIGDDVSILGTHTIGGVRIGSGTTIDGAVELSNGTIVSAPGQSTKVGPGVTARSFVFAEGAEVTDGAQLTRCFVGQCATVADGYSGEDILAFANCQLLRGEGVAVLAGPYTVSHHRSTLLIAGAYSFYNAGSATNASNHHYRLGPIEQAVYERGVKTGSGAYLLEPARIGVFSMVVGHHKTNPDTSHWPFSVLCERDHESQLMVGQNLCTMGLFRDAVKWKKRDRRRTVKSDIISYDVLNPISVKLMMEAVRRIEGGLANSKSEFLIEGGVRIRRALLPRAAKIYRMGIDAYLAKAYVHDGGKSEGLTCEWTDAGGLIAPLPDIRAIENGIAEGAYANVTEVVEAFRTLSNETKQKAVDWAVAQAREWYGWTDTEDNHMDAVQITAEAVTALKEAVLADATREWGPKMKVSYGLDGAEQDVQCDFEHMRGTYDENADVQYCRQYFDETW